MKLVCSACQTEYDNSLEFNQSNFFGLDFWQCPTSKLLLCWTTWIESQKS
jgi:hypothetical protein